MTAAAIRRGAPVKRKPVKVVTKRKGPSVAARVLAASPLDARDVERAMTFVIVTTVCAGLIAVALMLDLPRRASHALGGAIGQAGYTVKHIDITGIDRMDRMTVYAVALEQQSAAMPLLDIAGVRERLLKYGWIADARVSRRLPDTLAIEIVERKPAAIWQHAQQLHLIDAGGVILEPVKLSAMPNLPLVIGPDANVQSTALTALMAAAPRLKPVLDGAVWVGNRRWDLKFQSGETLLLPEGEREAAAALRKFAELDAAQRLLGKEMARFDMRNPGQMAVLPKPRKTEAKAEPTSATPQKPIDPALTT
jgi:cell division protein FtsQ